MLWRREGVQEAMGDGVGCTVGSGKATGSWEKMQKMTGCDRGGSWRGKPSQSGVKLVGADGSSVGSVDGVTLGSG